MFSLALETGDKDVYETFLSIKNSDNFALDLYYLFKMNVNLPQRQEILELIIEKCKNNGKSVEDILSTTNGLPGQISAFGKIFNKL